MRDGRDARATLSLDYGDVPDPFDRALTLRGEVDGNYMELPNVTDTLPRIDLLEPSENTHLSSISTVRWDTLKGNPSVAGSTLELETRARACGVDGEGHYEIDCTLNDDGVFRRPTDWARRLQASSTATFVIARQRISQNWVDVHTLDVIVRSEAEHSVRN